MESLYHALDPGRNEIRILLLQPSEDEDAQIEVELKQVSLSDNPVFEALSYVWGDARAMKVLLFNDQDFNVPCSSWIALQALRYPDRQRVLWIDAICINQQDIDEKYSQVRMMGAIYRKASSVRVWLGPTEKADDAVISKLRLLTAGNNLHEYLGEWGLKYVDFKEISQFFQTPWWTRLWVVQEVALGRHVVFQKGHQELEWEHLHAAYRNMKSHLNGTYRGFIGEIYDGGQEELLQTFSSVATLAQVRQLGGVESVNSGRGGDARIKEAVMNWSTIANLVRSRNATYDQDRLYALFGLLPLSVLALPELTPSITSSIDDIYIDVTFALMKTSECLMMLNFLGSQSSEKSARLPSWVPDWRHDTKLSFEGNLRVAREKMFDASAGAPFRIRRLSSNTLCLRGFLVDVITECVSGRTDPTAPAILHIKYEYVMDNVEFPKGLDKARIIKKILVWDRAPGGQEGTLKRLDDVELQAMSAALTRAADIGFEQPDQNATPSSEGDTRRLEYMMNCFKGRVVFTTHASLCGMGPSSLEAGDHIFIISGNTHPVILRPSKRYANTWRAVGECFMLCCMDGEVMGSTDVFSEVARHTQAAPQIRALKGTERNPRWDEITEQPGDPWQWLLIE